MSQFIENPFLALFVNLIHLFLDLLTLPIYASYNYYVFHRPGGWKITSKRHQEKLESIKDQIKIWNDDVGEKGKLCTARPKYKSISPRYWGKNSYHKIKLDLDKIVKIDKTNMTITVEPGIMMGRLTRVLVPMGWTIPVVPELETLTVGGLIAGAGIETSSHKYGLFHHTALSYEVAMSSGEIVTCSKDKDPELFYAIPGSYGTIGFLTAVTFPLLPAPKYVKISYEFFPSIEEVAEEIKTRRGKHEFIEGFAFSKNEIVLMYGDFSELKNPPNINRISRWYKPFFNQHVKSLIKSLKGRNGFTEYIPLIDYYHRHTKNIFWLQEIPKPWTKYAWYRFCFGYIFPQNAHIIRTLGTKWILELFSSTFIIQDYLIPITKLPEIFKLGHEKLEIFPVWLCPISLDKEKTDMFPYSETDIYVDIGFYGYPSKAQGKLPQVIHFFEDFCIKSKGFNLPYADCYMTREEFETMFDLRLYNKLREERNCKNAFPHVYDKICANARGLDNTWLENKEK